MMNKNKSKKKFNQIWSNQTNLGKKFGLSAIAVGKLLIEAGLKDPTSKLATEKALKEGYAKSTPLKDGTPYFMWNIDKVRPLISIDYKPLSKIDFWVNEVLETLTDADRIFAEAVYKIEEEGAFIMADEAYDDVPKDIVAEVRAKVEKIRGFESEVSKLESQLEDIKNGTYEGDVIEISDYEILYGDPKRVAAKMNGEKLPELKIELEFTYNEDEDGNFVGVELFRKKVPNGKGTGIKKITALGTNKKEFSGEYIDTWLELMSNSGKSGKYLYHIHDDGYYEYKTCDTYGTFIGGFFKIENGIGINISSEEVEKVFGVIQHTETNYRSIKEIREHYKKQDMGV